MAVGRKFHIAWAVTALGFGTLVSAPVNAFNIDSLGLNDVINNFSNNQNNNTVRRSNNFPGSLSGVLSGSNQIGNFRIGGGLNIGGMNANNFSLRNLGRLNNINFSNLTFSGGGSLNYGRDGQRGSMRLGSDRNRTFRGGDGRGFFEAMEQSDFHPNLLALSSLSSSNSGGGLNIGGGINFGNINFGGNVDLGQFGNYSGNVNINPNNGSINTSIGGGRNNTVRRNNGFNLPGTQLSDGFRLQ